MNNINIPRTNWQKCLPYKMEQLAHAISNHFQVDMGIVIPSILGFCSTSTHNKFEIEVHDVHSTTSYKESLSLFTIGIASSSERKSPVFKWLKRPIEEIVTEYNTQTADMRLRQTVKRETQKGEVKNLRRRIQKEPEGAPKRVHMEEQLVNLQREIDKPILEEVRMFLQDTTAIAAAEFLQKQKGNALTIADPEGGSFDAILEDHRLMESLLSGFSNEPISRERGSRPSVNIKNPHICVSILTQEVKLRRLAKKKDTWEEGFIPRCLIFLAQEKAGTRMNAIGPEIPQELEAWWKQRHQDLFDYPFLSNEHGEEICHTLRFSQDAAQTWGNVARDLEGKIQRMYPLKAWLGKMGGVVARLAGIYHLFESNNPVNEPIPACHVQTAYNLILALQAHMAEVHRLYYPDTNEDACNKIINWLHRERGTIHFFKLREMYRDLSIKSDAAHLACSHLVNLGVLVLDVLQLSDTKVGRKGTPVYGVNYGALHRIYPIF